ncbi:PREDICTED: uncharacterized protein LOC106752013 [Dinoponera quadriceps]|uniref:Uncharacterized protein LOC106752013 n=1 Tax=Dinoponera quadriceps TaxID=609295 RepID=A0A6P3YEJ8_DINQU|nr:PREDICTED: uncharacterized protein LOC106752013 [Dinoponera quadriceps]
MSPYQAREHRLGVSEILLLCFALVSSHEVVSSNHQSTPDASTLRVEARESEASITLGKDLMLGPPLPTNSALLANTSNSNDVATTRIESAGQVYADEISGSIVHGPVPNSPRWSSQVSDNRHWTSKGSKSVWKKDSYLEALRHSRNSDDPREGVVRTDSKTKANRREYTPGPVYRADSGYGPPDSTYPSKEPQIAYGTSSAFSSPGDSYAQPFKSSMNPNDHYGAPQNSYGPPSSSSYPQTSYGPPANSYQPPQQAYGPSIHVSPASPVYGAPYALPDMSHISVLPTFDLGWPIALKLNAFTIAKIILKLIIFKMIVKFIAAICLLLFIPKLEIIKKKGNKDEEDEERGLSSPYASSETLNDLESMVRSSVEKYEAQNDAGSSSTKKCTTPGCRVAEALTFRESRDDYLNLFKSYVEEERRVTKREEQ